MKTKLSFALLCALAVFAAGIVALEADDRAEDDDAPKGDVLVMVNGEAISKEQLYEAMLEKYGEKELSELIYRTILNQEFAKHHVTSSSSERERIISIRVERQINKIRQQIHQQSGGKLTIEAWLKQQGLDLQTYKAGLRKQMLEGEKNVEELIDTDVKMEKLARYYALTHDSIRVAHIQVKEKTAALEIIAKFKNGENFFQIAGKLSEDKYSKNNEGILSLPIFKGDWRFRIDVPGPEFENAAFALVRPGEICEQPIKSDRGWHVIKLLDRSKGEDKTFTELEQKIMKSILNSPISYEESNIYMMRLMAGSKIENKSKIKLNLPEFGQAAETPE